MVKREEGGCVLMLVVMTRRSLCVDAGGDDKEGG